MGLFQVNYLPAERSPAMAAGNAYMKTSAQLQALEMGAQQLAQQQQEMDLQQLYAVQEADRWKAARDLDERKLNLDERTQVWREKNSADDNRRYWTRLFAENPDLARYLNKTGQMDAVMELPVWEPGTQAFMPGIVDEAEADRQQTEMGALGRQAERLGLFDTFKSMIDNGTPVEVIREELNKEDFNTRELQASKKRVQTDVDNYRQMLEVPAVRNDMDPETIRSLEDEIAMLETYLDSGLDTQSEREGYARARAKIEERINVNVANKALEEERAKVRELQAILQQHLPAIAASTALAGSQALTTPGTFQPEPPERQTPKPTHNPNRSPAEEDALLRSSMEMAGGNMDASLEARQEADRMAQRRKDDGLMSFQAWRKNNSTPEPMAGFGPGTPQSLATSGSTKQYDEGMRRLASAVRDFGFGPDRPEPKRNSQGEEETKWKKMLRAARRKAASVGFELDADAWEALMAFMAKEGL